MLFLEVLGLLGTSAPPPPAICCYINYQCVAAINVTKCSQIGGAPPGDKCTSKGSYPDANFCKYKDPTDGVVSVSCDCEYKLPFKATCTICGESKTIYCPRDRRVEISKGPFYAPAKKGLPDGDCSKMAFDLCKKGCPPPPKSSDCCDPPDSKNCCDVTMEENYYEPDFDTLKCP